MILSGMNITDPNSIEIPFLLQVIYQNLSTVQIARRSADSEFLDDANVHFSSGYGLLSSSLVCLSPQKVPTGWLDKIEKRKLKLP